MAPIGDRVRVPDDGWGRPAMVRVLTVTASTVYAQRHDGGIAAFDPCEVECLAPDGEGRVFPLPRPESGEGPGFTLGLICDVHAVLAAHGYPMSEATELDVVQLRQVLFRFLYGSATTNDRTGSDDVIGEEC